MNAPVPAAVPHHLAGTQPVEPTRGGFDFLPRHGGQQDTPPDRSVPLDGDGAQGKPLSTN